MAYDIGQMKRAGITCVRIAEFAWLNMEPERGKFEFGWLHHVIDALRENGIAVILGTPTAAPPIWLIREHPDVAVLRENGIRPSHGGRRHCCSNNPHYIEASERIVEAMGREFGRDPNVVAFQLDNEIYTLDKGCMCDDCMERFHRKLEKKYGSVEELNHRWDLNTWSQGYGCFDEIPAPVIGWHNNPHLAYEWITCQQEGNMEFIWRQAEILRNYTKVPIGTDMMPMGGLDHEKTTKPLDIVMFNHYHVPENFGEAVLWLDFIRTLKDRPFIITETAATWNGTTVFAQYTKPEGFCRMNSWLPVALGGEGNMYWLWRQHWGGQELLHGSLLSPAGRPTHVFGEIQQTASEFERVSEICNATKVNTSVAMHFTATSWNLFLQQPLMDGFVYVPELARIHKAITKTGLRPDVIGAEHSMDGYQLIFSPFVMTLEDGDLAERISAWVKNGGVWVAGPATDIRNEIGAQYTDRALGMVEELLGVSLDYTLPTDGTVLHFAWQDGRELKCEKWVECYSGAGEALASVTGGHSAVVGKSVIRKVSCGKGAVILCGIMMSQEDLHRLVEIAVKTAGIQPHDIEGDLQVIPRKGEDIECLMLVETGNAPAWIWLEEDMADLITGQKAAAGRWSVEPYGIHILTRIGQERGEAVMEIANHPMEGKNLLFLGSSVTNGAAAEGVSFVDYIAERNGCNAIKEAISGTTLVDGEESYIIRLKRLDTSMDVDLFVCQLSTNDAGQKKPLGSVSASENRMEFDTETVAGAIEYIIAYVREVWNCPIAFYTSPRFDNEVYEAMVHLLKEIERKWEICVIDLWNDAEFNSITEEQKERYMVDDIHPTQAGYLEWWTPVFEKKIVSMLHVPSETILDFK